MSAAPAARDLERERTECVFSLGGGELSDEPWAGFAYWYEGPPEWAARDLDFLPSTDGDVEWRTVIGYEMFGRVDTPAGWTRHRSFSSSGERECWHCGPGTGNEQDRASCELCEGDGLVYLGEGWGEIVYRRVVPVLAGSYAIADAAKRDRGGE